jgi:hypothetical protein
MGVSGQRHALAALYPGERAPGTHCTGGWVASEPVWTQRIEEKSFAPAGNVTLYLQHLGQGFVVTVMNYLISDVYGTAVRV